MSNWLADVIAFFTALTTSTLIHLAKFILNYFKVPKEERLQKKLDKHKKRKEKPNG